MRISSDNDRQVFDLQRDALVNEGVDLRHIFQDKASGSKDNRSGLKDALDFMKSGDTLIVWKLDRLGRSLPHLLKIVTDLQKRNIGFKSITENMDTSTAHGEFIFSMFGALAQYERSLIQERIKSGLEAAAKRGKKGGRPRVISGEKMNAIKDALNAGASKASICRTFNVKRTTLFDNLQRLEQIK